MPQKYAQQIDSKVQLGMSLIFAAGNNDMQEIVKLINAGANVNYRDPKTGHTPLTYAIQTHSLEAVQALIGFEAELCKPDKEGFLPFEYALDAKKASNTLKSNEIVKAILMSMQDIDALDKFGGNSLCYAISYGDAEIANFILKLGANPNNNKLKSLPLSIAASNGDVNIVLTLLENEADPLFVNNFGFTPLSIENTAKNLDARKILWQQIYDANTVSADDFFVLLGGSVPAAQTFDGTMLQICKSLLSEENPSPFTQVPQEKIFRSPAQLLMLSKNRRKVGADCDELSCLVANAANSLLALPLENMKIIKIKIEGRVENHAALLVNYEGKNFLVDISGGIVKEIDTRDLKNSLNNAYKGYHPAGVAQIYVLEAKLQDVDEFMAIQLSASKSK